MIGLARMCWLAAVYRKSSLSWEDANLYVRRFPPLDRNHDFYVPGAAPATTEYYRLVDKLAARGVRICSAS